MIGLLTAVTWCVCFSELLSFTCAKKYRVCVVDGKGKFKRTQHYCPDLDKPDSKVECVVALDRLDCLRRISKGTADFSVFSPEDLVTAQNGGVEILVTNELRFIDDQQEYEVVAVVDNNSGIKSKYDLLGKRYCHPGYGYETDWTRILANYFEASVVTPMCDPKLSITENRVRDAATFFAAACKAGPWVNNPAQDEQLKSKYPNLCQLCGDPSRCSTHDKYWGRRGSLLCLTDGAGDVSWARLDDVDQHFGLTAGGAEVAPDGYSFLCPDDTLIPVNTSKPCVWVVKPWSVVASRRTAAQEIQQIISSLTHRDQNSWKFNLRNLIQNSYTDFISVEPVEPIESYLYRAKGYLKANSFSGCHPPRTIRICTISIIENAKCQWLRESSSVYGIEPDLECIKADNKTHCMQALNVHAADVVMVDPDMAHLAINKFNLRTMFYETVLDNEKYITVTVTRPNSKFTGFEDMRGAKACFPVYDGVAFNTVKHYLQNSGLIGSCPLNKGMAEFFGPSCTPGLPDTEDPRLKSICEGGSFDGEFGALHCLTTGVGDVAFLSKNSINKYLADDREDNPGSRLTMKDFEILCPENSKTCHLSWAPIGQAMVRANSSDLWIKDTMDVFLQLDELFGKGYQSLTTPLNMFGKFDEVSDLVFHDETLRLRSVPTARDTDTMPFVYWKFITGPEMCNNSIRLKSSSSVLLLGLFFALKHF